MEVRPRVIPRAFKPKRLALPILLLSTFLVKLAFAWRFDGYLTGDDLEIVETTGKYAWGLDYQPSGLRCLFHPLVLVWPVVKLAVLAGATDPALLSWLAAIPTVAFSALSVAFVYRLARSWKWAEATALAAAFLYATHWLPFGYGSTQYPRPISTALLLGAFLLVSKSPLRPSLAGMAGLAAAAAFAVRWSEGVVLVPLVAWTWWKRRDVQEVAAILAGFALGALLFVGLTDQLTWGAPFASFKEFVRILPTQKPPPDPGEGSPWYEYGKSILRWAGPLYLLLLWPARRDRRIRGPLGILAGIVVLLSCFRFRQWRYLQAGIPFLALAAALGWEHLRQGTAGRRWLATAALLLSFPLGLERTLALLRDKSQSATAAARFLAGLRPAPRVVALEQAWTYGERLYLGNGTKIRDFGPSRPLDPQGVERAAAGADAVALFTLDMSPAVVRTLAEMGFHEKARFHRDESKEVIVYLRNRSPRPREPRGTFDRVPAVSPPASAAPLPGSPRRTS